jgi:hypothetical protein
MNAVQSRAPDPESRFGGFAQIKLLQTSGGRRAITAALVLAMSSPALFALTAPEAQASEMGASSYRNVHPGRGAHVWHGAHVRVGEATFRKRSDKAINFFLKMRIRESQGQNRDPRIQKYFTHGKVRPWCEYVVRKVWGMSGYDFGSYNDMGAVRRLHTLLEHSGYLWSTHDTHHYPQTGDVVFFNHESHVMLVKRVIIYNGKPSLLIAGGNDNNRFHQRVIYNYHHSSEIKQFGSPFAPSKVHHHGVTSQAHSGHGSSSRSARHAAPLHHVATKAKPATPPPAPMETIAIAVGAPSGEVPEAVVAAYEQPQPHNQFTDDSQSSDQGLGHKHHQGDLVVVPAKVKPNWMDPVVGDSPATGSVGTEPSPSGTGVTEVQPAVRPADTAPETVITVTVPQMPVASAEAAVGSIPGAGGNATTPVVNPPANSAQGTADAQSAMPAPKPVHLPASRAHKQHAVHHQGGRVLPMQPWMTRTGALVPGRYSAERAMHLIPLAQAASLHYHVPTSLILAVALRETHVQNKIGDNGHGHGIMQIDSQNREWLATHDNGLNPKSNVFEGASKLHHDYQHFLGKGLSPKLALRAGVAAFNGGVRGAQKGLDESGDPDKHTTGHDYSGDVLHHAVIFAAILKAKGYKD